MRSVGVENCRSVFRDANDWLYRRAEANAVLLAAALLRRFGLPLAALRTHRDWSGKYCPHRILAENAWEIFAARVAAKLVAPKTLRLEAAFRQA